MDSEKKFKLDELPGEKPGGESSKPTTKKNKQEVDPRILNLQNLDDELRVEQMSRQWLFDDPQIPYSWIIILLALIGLELSGYFQTYMKVAFSKSDNHFSELQFLFSHPIIFCLVPLFFLKFNQKTDSYFEVTFDGLNVPRKINLGPREMPARSFIKWGEISKVKLNTKGKRPVIELKSQDQDIGEIFWDLKVVKKRALKIILNDLIPSQHPLRILVEKEVK